MKVIEVDQWTSSGNMETIPFDSVSLEQITGGDSEAAKTIFGGHFEIKEISEGDSPTIGNVWFKKGTDGNCEFYKSNFDTSD